MPTTKITDELDNVTENTLRRCYENNPYCFICGEPVHPGDESNDVFKRPYCGKHVFTSERCNCGAYHLPISSVFVPDGGDYSCCENCAPKLTASQLNGKSWFGDLYPAGLNPVPRYFIPHTTHLGHQRIKETHDKSIIKRETWYSFRLDTQYNLPPETDAECNFTPAYKRVYPLKLCRILDFLRSGFPYLYPCIYTRPTTQALQLNSYYFTADALLAIVAPLGGLFSLISQEGWIAYDGVHNYLCLTIKRRPESFLLQELKWKIWIRKHFYTFCNILRKEPSDLVHPQLMSDAITADNCYSLSLPVSDMRPRQRFDEFLFDAADPIKMRVPGVRATLKTPSFIAALKLLIELDQRLRKIKKVFTDTQALSVTALVHDMDKSDPCATHLRDFLSARLKYDFTEI